jgi:hypothetical protein
VVEVYSREDQISAPLAGIPKARSAPFGVAQACDEISADADCYVVELVRRRATPPGLASSSSRYALLSRRRPAASASAAMSTTTAIRIPSR